MSVRLLLEQAFGDMKACFYLDEERQIPELMLIPEHMEPITWESKQQEIDSLVQIKLAGDTYPGVYACGNTLRQSASVENMKYKNQSVIPTDSGIEIHTFLEDERGYGAVHHLVWRRGNKTVVSYVEFTNDSQAPVMVEMLSSFSLAGITPFLEGMGHGSLAVHRIRSVWSMEGRLETQTLEELQLEPSWAGHAVRCERFGQAGSLPVNHYFPYLVIEDKVSRVFWGMQIAHNASWQMELYRKDEGLSVSGGLADREFGHWMKQIKPDETFTTPQAILTVSKGGTVDDVSQRLASAGEASVEQGPLCEQELPIVFNEYCTTWGCPSHENISRILKAIRGKGFQYFVIDCGWFKEDGIPWDVSMGDYEVSKELFPEGLQKTVDAIKEAGLMPGIWFEIDNVGEKAKAYQMDGHLLKKDGKILTTTTRRFWNMADPLVEGYLTERVIGMLKRYGFQYMKMDYNDTIGIGCDDPDSLGEGLRKNMEASVTFIKKVKKEVPGIVLENCASGGQKQEPLMMGLASMSSFSDAHECEYIPIIAANLHRVILPRQSQIWAVLRKEDSKKRLVYSMANTFLGRMCLSGDVTELSEEQWGLIEEGMDFYKCIAPIIKKGHTYWYGTYISSYRHPTGWQGILRVGENKEAYLVIHTFYGEIPEIIEVDFPWAGNKENLSYEISSIYAHETCDVYMKENKLQYHPKDEMCAIAVRLIPALVML